MRSSVARRVPPRERGRDGAPFEIDSVRGRSQHVATRCGRGSPKWSPSRRLIVAGFGQAFASHDAPVRSAESRLAGRRSAPRNATISAPTVVRLRGDVWRGNFVAHVAQVVYALFDSA